MAEEPHVVAADLPLAAPKGPLVGYRVLDLGVLFAGPLLGCYLAELGADVVQVEDPKRGDPLRDYRSSPDEPSMYWKYGGRSKRTIAIDLREPDGQELVRQLAAHADVVVENFRPGVMERWGLGWDELSAINAALVMVRVSGFGQTGEYRDRPGFGTLVEAMSGFAMINGWPDRPPTLPPFGLADAIAALAGAMSTVAALLWRDARGGHGQVIDLALAGPIFSVIGVQGALYSGLGVVTERTGNRVPLAAPRGAYLCKDRRWVALSGANDPVARRVLVAIGRADLVDDVRFATNQARVQHADELDALLQAWIGEHDRAEVLRVFVEAEAPIAPVYSIDEIFADVALRERLLRIVPDPDVGEVALPNVLAELSATPGAVRGPGRRLDQDREAILSEWLGGTAHAARTQRT